MTIAENIARLRAIMAAAARAAGRAVSAGWDSSPASAVSLPTTAT